MKIDWNLLIILGIIVSGSMSIGAYTQASADVIFISDLLNKSSEQHILISDLNNNLYKVEKYNQSNESINYIKIGEILNENK